jgi:TonB family protein
MWAAFLERNGIPRNAPHESAVADAESALLKELSSGVPSPEWSQLARELLAAYVQERSRFIFFRSPSAADYRRRVSPCSTPADKTSGRKNPNLGRMNRSLEDFWPLESKRLGEQGVVRVSLHISATGCAVAAAIATSSGSEMLDEAVMKFYETIDFVPGEVDGKAVESTVTLPVVFKLTS